MNVSKYDDQVRSLINGHLHGIGKRLSEYCASAVDGGDVEELSREFTGDIDGYVEEGVREAWEQSEAMRRKMEDEARARKRRTAKDVAVTAALLLALQSFLSRKERVLAGSMAKDFARQTRSALPLLSGENAKERSRQLAEYIKNPSRINIDKVELGKGETPILKPQPSLFSRMRRILVTDIAMAYRTAEYHAWQLLPFVVGQEIRLGKRHPVPDICDDLQGIYPKDFKFTGWHPWCRCFARPIFSWESEKISEMPENFSNWMEENAERIEKAKKKGTLPQWIKENERYVNLPIGRSEPSQKNLAKQTLEWGRHNIIGKKTYSNPAFKGKVARFTRNSFTENLRYGDLLYVKSEILTHLDDYLTPELKFKFERPEHGTSRGFYKTSIPYLGAIKEFKDRMVELQFSLKEDGNLYFYFIKIL